MKFMFFFVILALFCAGCALPFIIAERSKEAAKGDIPLTEAGKNVQLMKSDPPPDCKDMGAVSGGNPNFFIGDYATKAKNEIRNNAAELGANYVRMEVMSLKGNSITGTAFKCP